MGKIIIDPRIKYNYATWYLYGLSSVFNKSKIFFDVNPFRQLRCEKLLQYNRGMPFIIESEKNKLFVFIDYFDDASIDEDRYEWCDIYAKINLTHEQLVSKQKVLAIGPSFGIRDHSLVKLLSLGLSNIIKSRGETDMSSKRIIADYLYPVFRRMTIDDYSKLDVSEDNNYVFQLSTLWKGETEKQRINNVRMEFLTACKELRVDIDGGFYYIGSDNTQYRNYLQEYKDWLYFNRIGIKEYSKRIAKSFVVFNCPAVAGCLGWKLAEYLLMGKAIISMPINHPMPGRGLVHGENVHIVHSKEEMRHAIRLIRDDKEYRERLGANARKYYDEYLAPERVIQRILGNNKND